MFKRVGYLLKVGVLAVFIINLNACVPRNTQVSQHLVTVVSWAQLGVPYKYGGATNRLKGLDCSGLVYYVYKVVLNCPNVPRTVKGLKKYGQKVWFKPQPGDLLIFNMAYRWYNPFSWGKISHVGIYLGDNMMIHAPKTGTSISIVYNIFTNRYWKAKYAGARRLTVDDIG